MTKACLISQQGSGSNLLRSLLNSHPDIVFEGEHFCEGRPWGKWKQSGKSIPDFLSSFYRENFNKKVVGFDLKYNQCEPAILGWLKDNDVKIIHLLRNPGRTALRMLNKKNRTLTYEQVQEHCKYVEKMRLKILGYFGGTPLKVFYERFTGGEQINAAADNYGPIDEILTFLGIEKRGEHLVLNSKYTTKPLIIRY